MNESKIHRWSETFKNDEKIDVFSLFLFISKLSHTSLTSLYIHTHHTQTLPHTKHLYILNE